MIDALDDALERFFRAALGHGPESLDLSFDLPASDWSAALTRPTVNLYLVDLREALDRRESAFKTVAEPGAPHRLSMQRAPLRVRLSYLLSCWARDPQDEHRLLWACLSAVSRSPTLPAEHCDGLGGATPRLEWRAEASTAEDVHALWAGLGNRIRPALQVHVSIEVPHEPAPADPLVLRRTLRLRAGGVARLPGQVLDEHGRPVAGAAVTALLLHQPVDPAQLASGQLDGQGGRVLRQMFSDDRGCFQLDALPPGPYLIIAELGEADRRRLGRRFLRLPLDEPASPGSIESIILTLE